MILITGGAGYIGSHCTLNFLEHKIDDIVVFDNLSTGHIETIDELQKVAKFDFVKGDLKNPDDINNLFEKYKIDAVIHFAAYSQVGESVVKPEKYYQNNVVGTINLLNAMIKHNCLKIVFSSTAAVYGNPQYTPIDEKHPKNPINPYGKTKLMIENILDDYDKAYNLKSIRLRYFNVIGADKKVRIGEWHNPETHLIPNIIKSTFQKSKPFQIFGDDYSTKDGTCIRDYIDVQDLIEAHKLALLHLIKYNATNVFNLGCQKEISVKQIFEICKDALKREISFEIAPKREGDPEILLANTNKANKILNWSPKNDAKTSILNAFEWEKKLQKIINS